MESLLASQFGKMTIQRRNWHDKSKPKRNPAKVQSGRSTALF